MHCVNCRKRAGYNRVVVELVRDERVGGLCRNCELDIFGHTLSKAVSNDGTCLLCDRDGLYAVPAWEPYEKPSDDGITVAVDFTVHERTARLCDEHFSALCGPESSPTVQRRLLR